MRFKEYNSIISLQENVLLLITQGEIDKALREIHHLVERIITEPLCTSQVFGSKTLDELCQSIGKVNLAAIKPPLPEAIKFKQLMHPTFVYIVTRLEKSGGHTRVIKDFIEAMPEARHIVLMTELNGVSDADYLRSVLPSSTNIICESAPVGDYRLRLSWLQTRLLEICPKRIYLFNHHQDSVAVAAIQPEMKIDASFYHHGDHHLCLGVYLSHLEHIDPHSMGYYNCREVLGIDNIYVPLSVDDKGNRSEDLPFMHNGLLTTCTAARSNKIEIPYFVSYLDLLPKLLQVTGGRHIHIGRLTSWALLKIRWEMKRLEIPPERFEYIPWVPSVWKALQDNQVDLYVASFPYGGGLTLIEAMGAGIPVALHKHVFSRILSGIDLAYSDVFSWRKPDDLLNYCASLNTRDLQKSSRSGRIQYEKFYSPIILQGILNDPNRSFPKPNNLSEKFSVESDEWALWMERQLSMKRVLTRVAYRIYRQFKAWWRGVVSQ